MTVTRRGNPDQPDRGYEFLGRVQVTIDDLEALIAIIREHSPDGTDELELKFFGGTFTEPVELRTLTDEELENIEIVNSKIEVNLSDYGASAAGDKELASIINRTWARPRRTRVLPKSRERAARIEQLVTAVALVAAILVVPVLAAIWNDSLRWSWGLPALAIAVALSRALVKQRARRLDDYAVIVPLTLDEWRKDQTVGRRQLITWLIATSAIAVTLLGILIGVLIKR